MASTPVILAILLTLAGSSLFAQVNSDPVYLKSGINLDIPFSQLSNQTLSEYGRKALSIRSAEWKHSETPHFEIHFFQKFMGSAEAIEVEFCYRYITKDLAVDSADQSKSHIFVFESEDDWAQLQQRLELEPWTGGVTIGNELFLVRDPHRKFKGHALAHELVHLLVHRFVGAKLPLWLEEGYAEDISLSATSAYYRSKGYGGRLPRPALRGFIPLVSLTSLRRYPPADTVDVFYDESDWLSGFLNSFGSQSQFLKMFKAMAQGAPFDFALRDGFGSRWMSLDDLEKDFKKHLTDQKAIR